MKANNTINTREVLKDVVKICFFQGFTRSLRVLTVIQMKNEVYCIPQELN